jgi:hypothetical protein
LELLELIFVEFPKIPTRFLKIDTKFPSFKIIYVITGHNQLEATGYWK